MKVYENIACNQPTTGSVTSYLLSKELWHGGKREVEQCSEGTEEKQNEMASPRKFSEAKLRVRAHHA